MAVGEKREGVTRTGTAYRVGVDIGGTFTDLLLVDEAGGAFHVGKTLTTPGDPSLAVEKGLVELLAQAGVRGDQVHTVVHGTTLLTNAIIEGKGARTALLTTEGFRDAIEIAGEHRYDMDDTFMGLPRPPVPRSLWRGVREQIQGHGTPSPGLPEATGRFLRWLPGPGHPPKVHVFDPTFLPDPVMRRIQESHEPRCVSQHQAFQLLFIRDAQ